MRGGSAKLGLAPNLLTLSRIPLAVAFPFTRDRPIAGLAVLGIAGLTDVLDGYLARKLRQESEIGQVLDPIADKVFAGVVIATLVFEGRLPDWGAPLLLVREAFELLAAGFVLSTPGRARARYGREAPTWAGKLTTFAQYAAAMAAFAAPRLVPAAIAVAGACGLVAGVQYAVRELAPAR